MLTPRASKAAMVLSTVVAVGSLVVGYVTGLAPLVALGWFAGGTALGLRLNHVSTTDSTRLISVSVTTSSLTTLETLTDLELRAKVRGAFDIARLLDRLEKLHPRLAVLPDDSAGLSAKLRTLFDTSATSLNRAFDLHVAARELSTATAREKMAGEQQRLVEESGSAVDALEKGLDRFATAAATAGTTDKAERLADLSGDLDRQLEVARRVEQRMRDLEARARGDYSAAEAYVTGA